jgi:hypothetical protein
MRPLPTLPLRTSRPTIHRRALPAVCLAVNHRTADHRPSPTHPDHKDPRPSTIQQMSPGARCTIAASNADYTRVRRPSDHPERLWDRAGEIVADPFQILYQKNYALCGNRLNLEFDLIQSLSIEPSVLSASPSGNSRYALFAVTSQIAAASETCLPR